MNPKYPNIHVELVGHDGNVFAVVGTVVKALQKAGVPKSEIDSFIAEATFDDYDYMLNTCIKWVDVN